MHFRRRDIFLNKKSIINVAISRAKDYIENNAFPTSHQSVNVYCKPEMKYEITKTTDVAMERFKALQQGENFHSLKESLKTNTYTDVKRTQNTICLRLNYNEPSGTVSNVRRTPDKVMQ